MADLLNLVAGVAVVVGIPAVAVAWLCTGALRPQRDDHNG